MAHKRPRSDSNDDIRDTKRQNLETPSVDIASYCSSTRNLLQLLDKPNAADINFSWLLSHSEDACVRRLATSRLEGPSKDKQFWRHWIELTEDTESDIRLEALTNMSRFVVRQVEERTQDSNPTDELFSMLTSLLHIIMKRLTDPDHRIREKCLLIMPELFMDKEMQQSHTNVESLTISSTKGHSEIAIDTILQQTHDIDFRVRAAALAALLALNQGNIFTLETKHYLLARDFLEDEEPVRTVALRLIVQIALSHPLATVISKQSSSHPVHMRQIDDAFVTVCSALTDASISVRREACLLLGTMHGVKEELLLQTFEKKIMSHLRRKITEHEILKAQVKGNSSYKAFGDMDVENVSLISSGACGAFVHGLEDEFYEVRQAAVTAICSLSQRSKALAEKALDFLADMFGDEIDAVRINAIRGMKAIAHQVIIREEQLEVMMGMLDDFSNKIRESMQQMLGVIFVVNQTCLRSVVDALLTNMTRYPEDRICIWRAMKGLGYNHAELAEFLLEDLLKLGAHFDLTEPNKDDPVYIAVFSFLANAMVRNKKILSFVPVFFPRHHSFLRHKYVDMIPHLDFQQCTKTDPIYSMEKPSQIEIQDGFVGTVRTLQSTVSLMGQIWDEHSSKQADTIARQLQRYGLTLERIGRYNPNINGCAKKMSLFARWLSRFVKDAHEGHVSNSYHGILYRLGNQVYVKELRCLAHALLVLGQYSRRRREHQSAQSNFTSQHVTKICERIKRLPRTAKHSNLRNLLMQTCKKIEGNDIGHDWLVILRDLVQHAKPNVPEIAVDSVIPNATIVSPLPNRRALEFRKGLPLEIKIEINLKGISDPDCIEIQVRYPDDTVQNVIPAPAHLSHNGNYHYKLLTSVFVTKDNKSSGPYHISIEVIQTFKLDVSDDPLLTTSFDQNIRRRFCNAQGQYSGVIRLCKPLNLLIKPIK
eukprot:m.147785 g.147785  ORF g.147785 m.147785 type:complete len:935 (+) comp14991_c0_seq4:316-3120(+)